jgi:hypothetical protein
MRAFKVKEKLNSPPHPPKKYIFPDEVNVFASTRNRTLFDTDAPDK